MQLRSCGSYCFMPLPDSAVDGSVIVVFTGHPQEESNQGMQTHIEQTSK